VRDKARTSLYQKPRKDRRLGRDVGETENIIGIRDRDIKKQLFLRKERTFVRIFKKTLELEVAKQIVGTSIRLRKMKEWTLRRGRSPPKRKRKQQTE
jgi:hypothetical protein